MTPQQLQVAAARRRDEILRGFGEDVRRLRTDAGATQGELSRLTGVDQGEISRIEAGLARPSIETCTRLGLGLGSDLSIRLFPNTGPPIRDRHQARIVESLVAGLDRRWRPWPEVGVRQPVRGWIDVVLGDNREGLLVATEAVSLIARLEQLLRWAGAKADALPSAAQWPFGLPDPRVDRLLVVRSTAGNRALLESLKATIGAAYPADPWQALASLRGEAPWPGSAMLWSIDRQDGQVAISATPFVRGPRKSIGSAS